MLDKVEWIGMWLNVGNNLLDLTKGHQVTPKVVKMYTSVYRKDVKGVAKYGEVSNCKAWAKPGQS